MPSKSIPEPWQSFLSGIDATLNEDVEVHCLGGFVITVLYDLARPTADVDVIAITPRSEIEYLLSLGGQGSDLHRKHKVYLQLVGVATVPDSYEERLTEIAPGSFKHLRLFALDPYDLALSKLERNTQRDRDDVRHLARTVPFDIAILQERYQKELRPYSRSIKAVQHFNVPFRGLYVRLPDYVTAAPVSNFAKRRIAIDYQPSQTS